MGIYQKALLFLGTMGCTMGAEPASTPAELVSRLLDSVSYLLDADYTGDTMLIKAARGAYNMPSATRAQLFDPFIISLLNHVSSTNPSTRIAGLKKLCFPFLKKKLNTNGYSK